MQRIHRFLFIITSGFIVTHSANGMCSSQKNATSNPGIELLCAALDGNTQLVSKLIENGADVNQIAYDGSTPLHFAASGNEFSLPAKYPTIIELLNKGALINKQNTKGNTPLHEAVKGESANKIGLLLRRGANVNIKNKNGRTPLHCIVKRSLSCRAVQTLLSHKDIDVNALDNERKSPLQIAIENGEEKYVCLLLQHPRINKIQITCDDHSLNSVFYKSVVNHHKEIICLLLLGDKNRRIDVNKKCTDNSYRVLNGPQSVLAIAIEEHWGKVIELLLKHPKINVNVSGINDRTPLHEAINECNEDIATKLITLGANINAQDHDLSSPLHASVYYNQKQIVHTLLQFPKINVNARDYQGNTPLHLAYLEDYEDIAELLLKHPKIDVNAKNNKGETPFDIASKIAKENSAITSKNMNFKLLQAIARGNIDKVTVWLQADANINNKVNGATPLCCAVEGGHTPIVNLLLSHPGVNVNIIEDDFYERTPLRIAIEKGDEAIVRLLLAHPKIDVNKFEPLHKAIEKGQTAIVKLLLAHPNILINLGTKSWFSTPLHEATSKGFKEIVCLLLAHPNIHIDNVNDCCETALHSAVEHGFAEIVELLLQSGADTCLLDNYLQIAARHGYTEVARVLLHYGANDRPQKTGGRTALETATDEGYEEIAQLLKEWSLHSKKTDNKEVKIYDQELITCSKLHHRNVFNEDPE